MLQRSIDKKIQVLRKILAEKPIRAINKNDKPYKFKILQTYTLGIPYKALMPILKEFEEKHLIEIKSFSQIPEFSEEGDALDILTDEYVFDILVPDEQQLLQGLKEYEKQAPKRQVPRIREKALELIAIKIGELDTGPELVNFLQRCGVNNELIIYPNTKWRMVFDALVYLSNSAAEEDNEALSKVIGEATHPLMHQGTASSAEALRNQFNDYLSYDNMGIAYGRDAGIYRALRKASEDEMEDIWFEEQMELEGKEAKELEFLCQPKNKEKISILRKAYQVFLNIVEVFCENPSKPSPELNDAYIRVKQLITSIVVELNLYVSSVNGVKRMYALTHYCIPFNNLFTAEKEYTPDLLEVDLSGKKLNWDYMRPRMNATYGDIDELYRKIEGSDILSKPDVQQTLNDVSLLLSKTKEENRKWMEVKQKVSTPQIPVQKIEITKIPDLRVQGLEKFSEKAKKQTKGNILFLNKSGDLYQEPKAKYCYPMSEAEGRHRIVRYFVENKLHQYYPTSEIARTLEKDEASLMKEIGKINASAQAKLKLKGGSILESKRGSGYRINPNYKITLKDN